jgi:hypothetical protein
MFTIYSPKEERQPSLIQKETNELLAAQQHSSRSHTAKRLENDVEYICTWVEYYLFAPTDSYWDVRVWLDTVKKTLDW